MSKKDDLAIMQKLVEFKYRQQQDSFARLIAQETRIRTSLLQLDKQLADSRFCADSEHKAIGADIVWQAWVGRKKRELNMQLAQILALKERHLTQVKAAYGKVLVTDSLLENLKKQKIKNRERSQLDRTLSSLIG